MEGSCGMDDTPGGAAACSEKRVGNSAEGATEFCGNRDDMDMLNVGKRQQLKISSLSLSQSVRKETYIT